MSIVPALAGTLWLVALTAAISVPLGVGTAVYMAEFAPRTRLLRVLESVLAKLAGVATVAYGLVGLALFARGLGLGPSILTGGLTLGALAVPMVFDNARKALAGVPAEVRWGGIALGASRWQVVRQQVFPAASLDIVHGCCTALVRAIGATAPLIMIGTVSFVTFTPSAPSDPLMTLPSQIFNWTVRTQPGFPVLAAGASLTLVFLAVCIRLVPYALRRALERRRSRA